MLEDMGVQADAHANSATGNAYYNVQGLGNASGLEIDFQGRRDADPYGRERH